MLRQFSNIVEILYKFPRKGIICTGNICTETSPTGTVKLSILLVDVRSGFSFTKTLLASTNFSIPDISDYGINTCFAYNSTSDGNASWKHTKYSQPTNLRWSVSYRHALAVAKVPVQLSRTSSTALQDLDTRFIIDSTDFCSDLSVIFFPELSIVALHTRFIGGTRGILFIAYI